MYRLGLLVLVLVACGTNPAPSTKTTGTLPASIAFQDASGQFVRQHLSSRLKPIVAESIAVNIVRYAQELGLPPELIAGIVLHESGGDSSVRGPVFTLKDGTETRANGLMQIVWEFWGGIFPECGENIFAIHTNVCYGAHILRLYLIREDWDVDRALKAYSGGAENYNIRVLSHTARMYLKPELEINYGEGTLRSVSDGTAASQ